MVLGWSDQVLFYCLWDGIKILIVFQQEFLGSGDFHPGCEEGFAVDGPGAQGKFYITLKCPQVSLKTLL